MYGPRHPTLGRFDVFYFDNAPENPRKYTDRAIASSRYADDKWTHLGEADSGHSVHGIYDGLWNKVNTMTSEGVRTDMQVGEDTAQLKWRASPGPTQNPILWDARNLTGLGDP